MGVYKVQVHPKVCGIFEGTSPKMFPSQNSTNKGWGLPFLEESLPSCWLGQIVAYGSFSWRKEAQTKRGLTVGFGILALGIPDVPEIRWGGRQQDEIATKVFRCETRRVWKGDTKL